nr:ubiquitin-like-specific protease 1D isoform X2 [Arachis hypogaea]
MDQQREPNSNSQKKRRLDLDWEALLPRHGDAPPPEIVVKPMASGNSFSLDDEFRYYTDHQLIESIQSKKQTLRIHLPMLKDGGVKILDTIKRQEEELARRRRTPHVQNRKLLMLMINREMLLAQVMLTDCMVVDTSGKETSHFRHCNNETIKDKGEPKGGRRLRSSSRNEPFQCATNLSKNDAFNDGKKSRAASSISAANIGKSLSRFFAPEVKETRQAIQSDDSRSKKGQPIVLDDDDDDDEPYVLEKTEQEKKLAECAKDAKMYYPSSDDPESVEICYSDIDCLAPESYLTSTIMNFYIRYLKQQASLANRSLSEYHFFNTYFYKKLQEAVSVKQSDRATFFVKFRRWWKGVNIFQKTYVLIPVHEDLHWSLIIICIPDKGDESGPIILHLDSLSLHSSRSLFDNIKSFLIEEKNYLDQEHMSSDVSIADRIWNCLPRRIETQVITVPQQRNDYDCGLFVLYFIERFIEEAPERLKKKNLAMFGKQWFKPSEASSLRVKIRKLLVEELTNSIDRNYSPKCSPSSFSGTSPTECAETAKDPDLTTA